MKVLLEQKDLNALVTTVAGAAATNNTISALSGIMLAAGGGKLTATCSNSEIGMRMSTAEKVEEEGRVLVNAHHFNDLVRKLRSGIITLEAKGSQLSIKSGRRYTNINTLPIADWPEWPDKGYVEKFSLAQSQLKTALYNTVFAVAKHHFRPVFTGVLINLKPSENEVWFVGTDSRRMACYHCTVDKFINESWAAVVPAKSIRELIPLLQGRDNCSVGVNGNKIMFCWENLEMYSRIIEGQYPSYHQLYHNSISATWILVMPG